MIKRLLLLVLVVAAAWYGSKNFRSLSPTKSHDLVLLNQSGRAIERVRISVADQTVVVEVLEDGATARVPFIAQRDGPFRLLWSSRGMLGEREWSGGNFTRGPVLMTHQFEFRPDASVNWSSALKPER